MEYSHVKRYAEKRLKHLDGTEERFIQLLKQAEEDLLEQLLIYSGSLSVSSGIIKNTLANKRHVKKILSEIRQYLSSYDKSISYIIGSYDVSLKIASDFISAVRDIKYTELDLKLLEKIKLNDFAVLSSGVNDVKKVIYDTLLNSVISKSSKTDLVNNLKLTIKNVEGKNGLLIRHAKNKALTAQGIFDQTLYTLKSKELGVKSWVLTGSLIKDSRQFCATRVNKPIKLEELEKLKSKTWTGKIAGVDPLIQRGGYSCRHIYQPYEFYDKIKKVA